MKPRLPGGFMLSCGVAAPVVGVVGVALAALLAPEFNAVDHGFSHLGVADGVASWVFNGTVVLVGVVAFPFGLVLAFTANNLLEKAGVACLWIGVFCMFLLGFVTLDYYAAHLALGLTFFSLVTVAFYVYGAGNVYEGRVTHGLVSIAFGALHQAAWLVWGVVYFRGYQGPLLEAPAILLPEAAGLLLLIAWVFHEAYGPIRDDWREVLEGRRMQERRRERGDAA